MADHHPVKVSVVIPTYNRAAYIRQAIDSVLQQTMTDFEIIVVDDGSTDDTREVVAGYGERIRYLRTANGGPARARNAGMAEARGQYIAWLDSDDTYHPAKLALQCAVLDSRPDTGLVYTECTAFDDDGRRQEYFLQDYHHSAYRRGGVSYDSLFDRRMRIADDPALAALLPAGWGAEARGLYSGDIFDQYLMNTIVFTNSILFRRQLLDQVGPQAPRFGLFHDLEFVLRLTRESRCAFLELPTYALRIHEGQISTTTGPRAPALWVRRQQDLLRVLRVHGLQDRSYYRRHRPRVDAQLARLSRVVAVLILSRRSGVRRMKMGAAGRARAYLRYAAKHGHRPWLLMLGSHLPPVLCRLTLAAESFWRRLRPIRAA